MPKMFIIAGPNGSGKTTFAKEYLPHYAHCPNFINADLIAQGLSPFSPASMGIKAGRLLLEQIHQFIEKGADFAIESTLAGKSYVPLLQKIKESDYSIHIFFLWIPDIKLAKARIKDRVRKGGHDVPSPDIIRRFHRSSKNFIHLYEPLCNSWIIFDNSTAKPVEIAHKENNILIVKNEELFNNIYRK